MPPQGSTELTLRIERSDGEYHVQEADSGATSSLTIGETLPFLPEGDQKEFWGHRTSQSARSTGKQLFAILFRYEILVCFTSALEVARSTGRPLRLRLDLEGAEELDDLPWELLA